MKKHPIEDLDSWENHLKRRGVIVDINDSTKEQLLEAGVDESADRPAGRRLRHHHHHAKEIEAAKEAAFWEDYEEKQKETAHLRKKALKHHKEFLNELYANPRPIDTESVHSMMIDAGSTGSRLHIYEWDPRILRDEDDIQAAVSGEKLSFPGTESRWTDRLRPGLASFASLPDDQLEQGIAEYLQPLLDFSKAILHSKHDQFDKFPIYLRATAGMRILTAKDRARVIGAVRSLFANKTYCPFAFVEEQARVLSGEEEAIYDWTGVNFLMGDLLSQSEGAGTVVNPRLTHGALDLGGGSTQISFYEPNEDVMSNLFKLQIGQAKHWNVYAHSFLFYGMNEAINRFEARLTAGKNSKERLIEGIYNPCMPGGAQAEIRTDIHLNNLSGVETWKYYETYPSGNGFYQAILKNPNERGDFDKCMELTKDLLHLDKNDWCDFAHQGDCSLAGIYQPELPLQSENFGEFLAFSNYYHVWQFLQLPEKATLSQLLNATQYACSMSHRELLNFTRGSKIEDDELDSYCFRSAYVFQLLHNGFGFGMNDTIRAAKIINGHKVGWALGAMLYEINALPWRYSQQQDVSIGFENQEFQVAWKAIFIIGTLMAMLASLMVTFVLRKRRLSKSYQYESIKDVAGDVQMP